MLQAGRTLLQMQSRQIVPCQYASGFLRNYRLLMVFLYNFGANIHAVGAEH